jgi:hypothetical protein
MLRPNETHLVGSGARAIASPSQTMLTKRALTYLSSLTRLPHTSVADVQATLCSQGLPCFPPWLDFHDRFAGYIEVLGRDRAIWGITHVDGTWLREGLADVDKELYEDRWYVRCADVHPSYNYLLDHQGEFLGYPADSFDIKVERDALVHELASRGKVKRLSRSAARAPEVISMIEAARQNPVPEASDQHFRYFAAPECIVAERVESNEVSEMYIIDRLVRV